jgi:hypothetical protein
MSCRPQTSRSIHGPQCISSPSLRFISYPSTQFTNLPIAFRNILYVHAADTENSRCFCACICHRWHTNGAGLLAAANVNWRAARATEDRAAILVGVVWCCVNYCGSLLASFGDMMGAKSPSVWVPVAYLARKLNVFAAGGWTATTRNSTITGRHDAV